MTSVILRKIIMGLGTLVVTVTAQADVSVPYTFTNSTTPKQSELNANFQTLANGINALSSRVDKLEAKVTSNQTLNSSSLKTQANTITSLSARINKLEGKLVMDDLAGNYKVYGLQNELGIGSTTYTDDGSVGSYLQSGTIKLNADGTYSASLLESGHDLQIKRQNSIQFLSRSLHRSNGSNSGTWSISGNNLSLSSFANGSPLSLSITASGRILVSALSNPDDGTTVLLFLVKTS